MASLEYARKMGQRLAEQRNRRIMRRPSGIVPVVHLTALEKINLLGGSWSLLSSESIEWLNWVTYELDLSRWGEV